MLASSSSAKRFGDGWASKVLHVIGLLAWVVVSFIGAQVIVVVVFGLLAGVFPQLGELSESVLQFILTALVYLLAVIIAVGGSFLIRQRVNLNELGVNKSVTWLDLVISPAAFIGYLVVSSIVVLLVSEAIPGFNVEQAQEIGFDNIAGRYDMFLAFLALVVVAPIAEEILFRGYLYSKLRNYTHVIVAALLTSALFGAIHMQWNVAVDTFILSLVMCGLRELTGSIWAGTLVHMIKNGLAFFLLFIYPTLPVGALG